MPILLNKSFEIEGADGTILAMDVSIIDAAPTIIPASEEVYNVYTDTVGNSHWTGTQSGEHIIQLKEGE